MYIPLCSLKKCLNSKTIEFDEMCICIGGETFSQEKCKNQGAFYIDFLTISIGLLKFDMLKITYIFLLLFHLL